MTRTSRLGLYADLQPVLDAAIAAGGGTYTLATHGDAVHWRQRVYKFRKLWQQERGPSRYDALLLRRIPDDSSEVIMEVRVAQGIFTPGFTAPPPSIAGLDAAEDAAFALARRLVGEG